MRFLKLIIVTFLPICIITTNLLFLALNKNFYYQIFEKESIYQTVDKETVHSATNNLLGYFRGQNMLEDNFFSSQAKMHLADVKSLLQTVSFVNNVSIFIVVLMCLIFIKKKMIKALKKSFLSGSVLLFSLVIILVLLFFLNFNFVFVKFHQIFFSNNLWLFPTDDNLIRLFPESFFVEFTKQLILDIAAVQVLLLFLVNLLPNNDSSSN